MQKITKPKKGQGLGSRVTAAASKHGVQTPISHKNKFLDRK
jgi:hypothetical protein